MSRTPNYSVQYQQVVREAKQSNNVRTLTNLLLGDATLKAVDLFEKAWVAIDFARSTGTAVSRENARFVETVGRSSMDIRRRFASDVGIDVDTLTTYARICKKFPAGSECRNYLIEKEMSFHYLRSVCTRSDAESILLLHRFYEESIPVTEAQVIAGTRETMFRSKRRSCDYCGQPIEDKMSRVEVSVGVDSKRAYCRQDHFIKAMLEGQETSHIISLMSEIETMLPGRLIDV